MIKFNIVNIIPASTGSPASIEVAGDASAYFHGREILDIDGSRYPSYSTVTPTSIFVKPTEFRVEQNDIYSGLYTVYTPTSITDYKDVELIGGNTLIHINETIDIGNATARQSGIVVNPSTFAFTLSGEGKMTVMEGQYRNDRPVVVYGSEAPKWAFDFQQNVINTVQHFAGDQPPSLPFQGMIWYNSSVGTYNYFTGATWEVAFGKYTHQQTSSSTTWIVNHGLGQRLVDVVVFANVVGSFPNEVRRINPDTITFNSESQVTLTFTTGTAGTAIIRVV